MSDVGSRLSFDFQLFTTCPPSTDQRNYARRVIEISQWSEEFDCRGMLIYADNGLVDPWVVAQIVIQNTRRICPFVAVQPIYMHPYSVAKLVASIGHLYHRQIALNMVAGGFRNDLIALGDTTEHDDRYLRLTEYAQIIRQLLEADGTVAMHGRYYSVKNLKMTPPQPRELFPEIFVSGSSAAAMTAAATIGATAIRYPRPAEFEAAEHDVLATGVKFGARLGIIAREDSEEAWRVARERFPIDRRGQLAHQIAVKTSDSVWHQQLSQLDEHPLFEQNPYWLGPMLNYKTFCPYLVGSISRVAQELGRYLSLGFRTFILDIPPSRAELAHVVDVFRRAADPGAPCAMLAAAATDASDHMGASSPRC